jgi:3-hydroxyacyl-[acyl-carrier-protein] dehydratase
VSGSEASEGQAPFTVQDILQCLPHRYPFLLVDRILEAQDDVSCIGVKNVSFNEPHFQGHFPGEPVMPGVLIIEGMAQTAGAFCIRTHQRAPGQKPPLVYFLTIDKAKFRKPVVPGDQLMFHIERTNRRRNMWWFHGRALVDGQCVCEADFSAMLTETAVAR